MVRFIYRIYPEYSDNSTPYHTCTKFWTSTIYYPNVVSKNCWISCKQSIPDETPAASHLGLHCLLRPVCPNTYGKYGKPVHELHHEKMCLRTVKVQLCQQSHTQEFCCLPICSTIPNNYVSRQWRPLSIARLDILIGVLTVCLWPEHTLFHDAVYTQSMSEEPRQKNKCLW